MAQPEASKCLQLLVASTEHRRSWVDKIADLLLGVIQPFDLEVVLPPRIDFNLVKDEYAILVMHM